MPTMIKLHQQGKEVYVNADRIISFEENKDGGSLIDMDGYDCFYADEYPATIDARIDAAIGWNARSGAE